MDPNSMFADTPMLSQYSRPFFICDEAGGIACIFGNIDIRIREVLRRSTFRDILVPSEYDHFDKFRGSYDKFTTFAVKNVGIYNMAAAVSSIDNFPNNFSVLLYVQSNSLSPTMSGVINIINHSIDSELDDIKRNEIRINVGEASTDEGYCRESENVLLEYNRSLLSYIYLSYPGFFVEDRQIFSMSDALVLMSCRIHATRGYDTTQFNFDKMKLTDMLYCDYNEFLLVLTTVVRFLLSMSADKTLYFISCPQQNTISVGINAPHLNFIANDVVISSDLFNDIPQAKLYVGFIQKLLSMSGGELKYSRVSPKGMFCFIINFTKDEIPFLFENSRFDYQTQIDETIPAIL